MQSIQNFRYANRLPAARLDLLKSSEEMKTITTSTQKISGAKFPLIFLVYAELRIGFNVFCCKKLILTLTLIRDSKRLIQIFDSLFLPSVFGLGLALGSGILSA